MKSLVVKQIEHVSKLGRVVFYDVPVFVDDEVTLQTFDTKKTDFGVSGDEIKRMDREIARQWLNQFERSKEMSSDELHGIQLILGVNGTELGNLLGLDKSTISKIYSGIQTITKPWALLAVSRLKDRLDSPDLNSLRELEFDGKQVSVDAVSDELLRLSQRDGDVLSNMKINKLLYYVQGWSLALFKKPMFPQHIVAYDHGPVVIPIYRKYKDLRAIPLPESTDDLLTDTQKQLIQVVYRHFGKYTAWKLREMTHRESPWIDTKRSQIITHKQLKDFFSEQLSQVN